MPTVSQLAQRIWNYYIESYPEQREVFIQKVQNGEPVFAPNNEDPIVLYWDLDNDHRKRTWNHLKDMKNITDADANFTNGVDKALDHWDTLRGMENPDILYHALDLYILEYAKRLPIQSPSILVKEPEMMESSSNIPEDVRMAFATGPDEPKLDWFREDPLLNEHHAHWHNVYTDGSKDRHGEMFFYMHQQMIARYNAERLSVQLNPVGPFNNMLQQPISVGYKMGDDVRLSRRIAADRQPNTFVLPNLAQARLDQLKSLEQDIDQGAYDPDPNQPDKIKAETDAISRLGVDVEFDYHGNGHVNIARINGGVMGSTTYAIRDVVFWEWHKGIDDLGYRWQQKLAPYNFAAEQSPVTLRKSTDATGKPFTADLILCYTKDIPDFNTAGFNGDATGLTAFGGANWNKEFASGTSNFTNGQGQQKSITFTDTLVTTEKSASYSFPWQGGTRTYDYKYTDHEPFGYFIRLENSSLIQKKVTVRLFIVPEGHEENRRMWIEMDKFLKEIPPQSKIVAFRKDTESSVIRKPAVRNPATHNVNFNPISIPDGNAECDCGWPYHLLVPRGSAAGMSFRMMMMVTDAAIDLVGKEPDCGSLSFCGAQSNLYPDKRPLGYPFNKKFNGGGKVITNAIMATPSMACRSIRIKQV